MIGPCKKDFTKNMPDKGNFVFHSGQGQTPKNVEDPPLSVFKENLVADLGISPNNANDPRTNGVPRSDEEYSKFPKPGYQNGES